MIFFLGEVLLAVAMLTFLLMTNNYVYLFPLLLCTFFAGALFQGGQK